MTDLKAKSYAWPVQRPFDKNPHFRGEVAMDGRLARVFYVDPERNTQINVSRAVESVTQSLEAGAHLEGMTVSVDAVGYVCPETEDAGVSLDGSGTDRGFMQRLEDEREHQRRRWGDYHDDSHSLAEWTHILANMLGRFSQTTEDFIRGVSVDPAVPDDAPYVPVSTEHVKKRLVDIAAVAMAAYEAIDRHVGDDDYEFRHMGL